MHRKAIDVVDHARTDGERKRRIAVEWNTRHIDTDITRDPWFFLDVEMHSSARSQRRNAAPFLYSSPVKLTRAFETTAGHCVWV
jgi:hypothetical protein